MELHIPGLPLRAVTLLGLGMLGRSVMLWVKLPFIETIHPQSDKVVMGPSVKINAKGGSNYI